jgi:mannose-6-phosphate isomerase-like protein (cupin superfamily)
MIESACRTLYAQTVALINANATLASFSDVLPSDPAFKPFTANNFPVVAKLNVFDGQAHTQTAALTHSICALAPKLNWQQTYTAAQVGQTHLRNYGWFNILSPDGIFLSEDFRISVGVWLKGLFYPEHRHEPEEHYMVLAGGGVFRSGTSEPRLCEAGDTVHYPSNIVHSIDMADHDLMALAVWRGDGLMTKSAIVADV